MNKTPIRDLQPIALPEPVFDRCLTVFEALKVRRTSRSIGVQKIALQILSDILWAARGGLLDRPAIHRKSASMSPWRKGRICMNQSLTGCLRLLSGTAVLW